MKSVVIVGGGQAAMQTVDSLRREGFEGGITLVSAESWLPYQRPPLSKKYLAGALDADRLFFRPEAFYADRDVTLLLDTRVTAIDRVARNVRLEHGHQGGHAGGHDEGNNEDDNEAGHKGNRNNSLPYDALVLATGARVRTLEVPGAQLPGVCSLRSLDDADVLRSKLANAGSVAIIGAGFIGLEVAAVGRELGLAVTVIEREERVLPRSVSPIVSEFLQDVHTRNGVTLRLGVGVSRILGETEATGVALSDGTEVASDLVLVGVGVVPNVELAQAAGLACDDGICVDPHCRTADPTIFAVGDCTQHFNPIYRRKLRLESVQNAVDQARVAAANLVGRKVVYSEVPWFWSDQFDIKLQMAGLASGYNDIVVRGRRETAQFSVFYFDNNTLLAVDSVNRPADHMAGRKLLSAGVQVSPDMAADEDLNLKDLILSER